MKTNLAFLLFFAELEPDAEKTTHATSTTSHNIIQANLESKLTEIFAPTSSGTATPAHPLPNHSHVAHAPPSSLASQLNAQLLTAAAAKDGNNSANGQSSSQPPLTSAPATISHTQAAAPELTGSKSRPGSYGEEDVANSLLLLKQSSPPPTPAQQQQQSVSPTAEVGALVSSSINSTTATTSAVTYASAAAAAISSSPEPEATSNVTHVPSSSVVAESPTSTASEQPLTNIISTTNNTALKTTTVMTTSTLVSLEAPNLGRRPSRFSVTPVVEPSSTLHQIADQVTAETLTTPTTTTTNTFPKSSSTGSAPSSSPSKSTETTSKVVSSIELKTQLPSQAPQQSLKLSRFTVTPCTSLPTIGGETLSAEQIALNSSNLKDSYSQTSPVLLKVIILCNLCTLSY